MKAIRLEPKILPFRQLKMLEEGDGGATGYPSETGRLDDGGDVVLKGAFTQGDDLAQFLTRGFIARDHDWSMEGAIGMPTVAREDDFGLYSEFVFHGTSDVQRIRQKMRERHERKLGVFLSIGYLAWSIRVLMPDQYAEELPKVLKPEALEESMAKSRQFSKIRLLPRVKLYEYSVVTVPMLATAEVVAVKAAGEGGTVDAFEQFKSQYLGAMAEAEACYAAINDLIWSLQWRLIEPALFDSEIPADERMERMKAGLEEFGDLCVQIATGMMAMAPTIRPVSDEAMEEMSVKALVGLPFGEHTRALGTALSTYLQRASWDRERRQEKGRPISHADAVSALAATLASGGETLTALLPAPEPVKADPAAVEAALARFRDVEARLVGVPA